MITSLLLWASLHLLLPSTLSFQSPVSRHVLAHSCTTNNGCNLAAPDGDTAAEATPDIPFFASWPKWLQHGIRDSGGVKILVDTATRTLAAPIFYYDNPWCFPEFCRISGDEYPWLVSLMRIAGVIDKEKPDVHFSKEAYGDHYRQIAQVMINASVDESEEAAPLFIFLHGGAWASGFPTMYRLISMPFLERNFRSVILGYRTYPEATIEGQMDDLCLAVDYFAEKYGESNSPVVLMGHSSGAHISMLAALKGRLPTVDAFISASGVYDLENHIEHERRMGWDEISPMSGANGFSLESLRKNSPSRLIETMPLDLPPVLLLHGGDDGVLLPKNSKCFHDQLQNTIMPGREKKQNVKLEIVEGVGHQEIVLDTCLGGMTQSKIVDWLEGVI